MTFAKTFAAARIAAATVLASAMTAELGATVQPILETHNDSLTTYKPGASTNIQDILPLAQQRGVNLDGSLRLEGGFPMSLSGNPFGESWNRTAVLSGVRLDTGTPVMTDVDLELPAPGFSWVIGRSYNPRQKNGTGAYHDSGGYQGWNWFQLSQPELVFYDDPQDAAKDLIYLVYGADRYIEFKRQDSSSSEFKGVNGAAGAMQLTEASEQGTSFNIIIYTDQRGWQYYFYGFGDGDITNIADAEGQLWKIVAPAPDDDPIYDYVAYVGGIGAGPKSTLLVGYDTYDGRMRYAYDTAGRKYTYAYNTNPYRLTQVKVQVGSETVAQVDYAYYGSGDLKLVTISTPLTESDDGGMSTKWLIRKKHYRCYEDAGKEHLIKYVYDSEGLRRFDWSESGTGEPALNDGFLGATDTALREYASAFFDYDADRRISTAWFNGSCGCGGSSNGTHTFTYEPSGYTNTSAYDTAWASRTIVERPVVSTFTAGTTDDVESWVTQYFDEVGQPLHRVATKGDPAGAPQFWATQVVRNSSGWITAIHSPANITAYTHNPPGSASFTASPSAGLVTVIDRHGTNVHAGYVDSIRHRTGASTSNPAFYDHSFGYLWNTQHVGDVNVDRVFIASHWVYTQETTTKAAGGSGPAGAYETTYAYDFYGEIDEDGTPLMLQELAITHPAVSTSTNGPGFSVTGRHYFDEAGRRIFEKTTDGIVNFWKYRAATSQLEKIILDADTADTGHADHPCYGTVPFNFQSSGTEMHRVICYSYAGGESSQMSQSSSCSCALNAQGNTSKDGDGPTATSYTARLADGRFVTLSFSDYEDLTGSNDKYFGPVTYTVHNLAGRIELEALIGLDVTTADPINFIVESYYDPLTALVSDLSDVTQTTTSAFSETGRRLEASRVYFANPGSGQASDYDATIYGYDDLGRLTRLEDPTGTIHRTVHDALGRVTERWIGTNDYDFDGGATSGPDNMVQSEALAFDSGNGYLTSRTLYPSATAERETQFANDARGNVLLVTDATPPHVFSKYDNRGQIVASALYSNTQNIVLGTDDPTTETSNRLALDEMFYDELGRVYKTKRHKIGQSNGADLDNLESRTWYDMAGRMSKTDDEQLVKIFYDRLGRQTRQFILADTNDGTYSAHVGSVSGDHVLQEQQTVYESVDSDDVVLTAVIDRFHDDWSGLGGETTGALDTNADGDDLKYTNTNIEGRIQITAHWYDDLGRVINTVHYGDYGSATFNRNGLSVPSRSDTALVTSYLHNDDGTLLQMTDPKALKTVYEYDATGRTIKVVNNCTGSQPGECGDPSGSDDDQTITYQYTDGLMTAMTADVPSGEDDQVTTYTYGVSPDDSPGASQLDARYLLRQITYPDSGVVRFAYNALGESTWAEDQAGNVIETEHDGSGRVLHLRATNIEAGFDGAVKRISTSYDSLGRPQLVTQYNDATSGSVIDQSQFSYDDWGLVSQIDQDRDSAITGGSGASPYWVAFAHQKGASGGRVTLRRSGMTLPDGTPVTYTYPTTFGHLHGKASRVWRVVVGSNVLAQYDYNGVEHVVGTDLLEPDVESNLYTTSGAYPGLDRFNRVETDRWSTYPTVKDLYLLDVEHDRNSNITLAQDSVHAGFDVSYTIDNLDRLVQAEEGTWNSGTPEIDPTTRNQIWSALSQTGNWDLVKLDLDGNNNFSGSGEYEDSRTHNAVNELTARDTNNDQTDDAILVYDDVGNLIDDGEHYKYEYDVFGRLRGVRETASPYDLVAEYRYNGLGHRLGWHYDVDADSDVDGDDPWFYFVYDDQWRVVATFHEDDPTDEPKEQFIHHNAGLGGFGDALPLDSLILRDRDKNSGWNSPSDGDLEERVYYCQNWRGDVVALVTDLGEQIEQVRYSAYGVPFGLPAGDMDSDGDVDSTDLGIFNGLGSYDVRGDLDLDADNDTADRAIIENNNQDALGWSALSLDRIGSRRGYAGYELNTPLSASYSLYHVRHRVLNADLGRWMTRDPLDYVDGVNLYEYVSSNPLVAIDPYGTNSDDPEELSPGGLGLRPRKAPRDLPCGPGNSWCRLTPCDEGDGSGGGGAGTGSYGGTSAGGARSGMGNNGSGDPSSWSAGTVIPFLPYPMPDEWRHPRYTTTPTPYSAPPYYVVPPGVDPLEQIEHDRRSKAWQKYKKRLADGPRVSDAERENACFKLKTICRNADEWQQNCNACCSYTRKCYGLKMKDYWDMINNCPNGETLCRMLETYQKSGRR